VKIATHAPVWSTKNAILLKKTGMALDMAPGKPTPAKKSVAITEPKDPADVARRALMEKERKEAARKLDDFVALARRLLMEKERKQAARNAEDPVALRSSLKKESVTTTEPEDPIATTRKRTFASSGC
jgi:hypothetical protein